MIRCFVAIPVPEPLGDTLRHIQDACPVGRPVATENLHLTLAFLGEQDGATVKELALALAAAARAPGFEVTLDGLDCYGGRQPRTVAVPARPDPPLKALHDRVRRATRAAGPELPRRRFRPHVTLQRINAPLHPDARAALGRFVTAEAGSVRLQFWANGFALYRSTLSRDGARYDVLAQYDFADAVPG